MQPQIKDSALLFPGQGVPAREVIEYYTFLAGKTNKTGEYIQLLQAAFDEVNPGAKFDTAMSLSDENSPAWPQTSFVQPLTYALSILTYELIKKTDEEPMFILGHSLGAFSALTAAGALDFEKGVKIVTARGKFMQDESEKLNNGMIAILGLTQEKIKEICDKTGCVIALINAPTAFVVAGPKDMFALIDQTAMNLGARKTIPLSTSGAFHTQYMQGAYDQFKEFVKEGFLQAPRVPVVTNIGVSATKDPKQLENDVIESFIRPVDWKSMMEFLISSNVSSFIEVGPGNSLSALCKMNGVEREQVRHAKDLLI